jgi:hypothetical protein
LKSKLIPGIACAFLLSGIAGGVEVVYKAPIRGLALETQLRVQVVPDGYIVIGNLEVTKLDDKHQIEWQFKPHKARYEITSFFYAGDGSLIIGGWEKSGRGKKAWLLKLSSMGTIVWDRPVDQAQKVLAISGLSAGGFYALTEEAGEGSGGGQLKFFDAKGNLKERPKIEVVTAFAEDISMFHHADSTVTIFGGTVRNTLEAVRISIGKRSLLLEHVIVQEEAFYRKLKGFVNFIVHESPNGGYYAAFTAMGSGENTEDYRVATFDDRLKLLSTKDFGGNDSDGLSSMILDDAGDIVLAGYSYSGVSRDKSEPAFEEKHCDVWLIKVDVTGTKVWDKTLTGPGCILQARVFSKGGQIWVVYGEEGQVMIAALRE